VKGAAVDAGGIAAPRIDRKHRDVFSPPTATPSLRILVVEEARLAT
jgi:hypothetical protein